MSYDEENEYYDNMNISDIDDNNYFSDDYSNEDNEQTIKKKVIMDLDDNDNENVIPNTTDENSVVKKSLKLKKKLTPKAKNTEVKQTTSIQDLLNENEIVIKEETKSKKKTKEPKESKEPKEPKKPKESKDNKVKKTKEEESFEFNQENIDFFSKDLDYKKILIKQSHFTHETKLICLLLKHNLIEEYKCSTVKCKVKNIWNGKPIQLILIRKNSIQNDLSIDNLELICANCYMTLYGLEMFVKKKKEAILNCEYCNFPLVKFSNNRKKKGTCIGCEKKMNKYIDAAKFESYNNELKETYKSNLILNDDINTTNYYKEVSRYKSLDSCKGKQNGQNSKTNDPKLNSKSNIIVLNTTVPDLSALITDEDEDIDK
jgi:hypothetical protein